MRDLLTNNIRVVGSLAQCRDSLNDAPASGNWVVEPRHGTLSHHLNWFNQARKPLSFKSEEAAREWNREHNREGFAIIYSYDAMNGENSIDSLIGPGDQTLVCHDDIELEMLATFEDAVEAKDFELAARVAIDHSIDQIEDVHRTAWLQKAHEMIQLALDNVGKI